jgi:drug/metabolite transporter (DMT)-like permease
MNIGDIAALLTALSWSLASLAFSHGVKKIGSISANVCRLLFASVFLLIIIAVSGIPFNLSLVQTGYLIISGIIGLVIGDTFLFNAYEHIGPRLSMLLMATVPAMSALLAFVLFGEALSFKAAVGILITIIGIGLVLYQSSDAPAVKYKINANGIVFGLLAALGQALGLIFAKFAFQMGDINGFTASFIRISFSTLIMLPVIMRGKKHTALYKVLVTDKKVLLSMLTGAFLGSGLGITLSLIAVQKTKVGIASTLMATAPIMMLPMVKIFFKEHLSWQAILGAFIAVGGIAVLFL